MTSLPATIALLHEYFDFFLVRTSEAAAEIAETLMEIFRF